MHELTFEAEQRSAMVLRLEINTSVYRWTTFSRLKYIVSEQTAIPHAVNNVGGLRKNMICTTEANLRMIDPWPVGASNTVDHNK